MEELKIEPVKIEPFPKKKFPLFKVVGGLIILVLLGLTISLYTRAFDPHWNPFRLEPEEVMAKMTLKMDALKTVHSLGLIEIKGKEDAKEVLKLTVNFKGDFDQTDPKIPKLAGDFEVILAFEGMEFSLAGESRTIGEISYFKLTTVPAVAELEPFFHLFRQWIKIDPVAIGNWIKNMMGQMSIPGMEEMWKKQIEKQKEMKEKLERLIVERKPYLIKVKKELPDKEIGETKVYHYLLALNKEEGKKLILEIMPIYLETVFEYKSEFLPEELRPSPEEIAEEKKKVMEETEKALSQFFEKIGEIEGEVWIGKKDLYLYRFR